jgi:hypothetical protein
MWGVAFTACVVFSFFLLSYFAKTVGFVSCGNIFSFLFTPFFEDFEQINPFCCNRSTTNLFKISFPSRTLDFVSFFLSLWNNLWLAETSQQSISWTTWLKVIPHCNHCNHTNSASDLTKALVKVLTLQAQWPTVFNWPPPCNSLITN